MVTNPSPPTKINTTIINIATSTKRKRESERERERNRDRQGRERTRRRQDRRDNSGGEIGFKRRDSLIPLSLKLTSHHHQIKKN